MHGGAYTSHGARKLTKALDMIIYNLIYGLLKTLALLLKPILGRKTQLWIELRQNQNLFRHYLYE